MFVLSALDHQENDCDEAIRMKKAKGSVSRGCGSWLRAEGLKLQVGKPESAGFSKGFAPGESHSSDWKTNSKEETQPSVMSSPQRGQEVGSGGKGKEVISHSGNQFNFKSPTWSCHGAICLIS